MMPGGLKELKYEVRNGKKIFQDDIVLTQPDLSDAPLSVLARAAVIPTAYTNTGYAYPWEGGIVRYQIDPAFSAQSNPFGLDVPEIQSAIASWEQASSLTFVESGTGDHIFFLRGEPNDGCYSPVGRQHDGQAQNIRLGPDCDESNVVHEIGHALGLFHEQSRVDRDDHIIVNYENIQDEKEYNFDILDVPSLNIGKYNFNSVMHYDSLNSFAIDASQPTLTKLNGGLITASDTPTNKDICGVERFNRLGRKHDVNLDGFADLPIGSPYKSINVSGQGIMTIAYGASGGIDTAQRLYRGLSNVEGNAQAHSHFGSTVAMGDFNGDCYVDIAVGLPDQNVSGLADAGAVHIFYGSALGASATDDEIFHLNGAKAGHPVVGQAQANAKFGASLEAADFDGDGYQDLAIGMPYYDIAGANSAGGVVVLYGGSNGLKAAGSQLWSQFNPLISDTSQSNDRFGFALAGGDINGDGFEDLAIGVPGETVNGDSSSGAVHVIFGTVNGLGTANEIFFDQTHPDFPGTTQSGDQFGFALALGDFDRTGTMDLVVGAPYDDIDGQISAGRFVVIPGGYGPDRLLFSLADGFNQTDDITGEASQQFDYFGSSFAVGDFDGDTYDDLAVAAPNESHSATYAGMVHVLYGGGIGLSGNSAQTFTQATSGIADSPQTWDRFGKTLTSGDYNGDGYADLVIGVPHEGISGDDDAGVIHVLYGAANGITTAGSDRWTQSTGGSVTIQPGDLFGGGL